MTETKRSLKVFLYHAPVDRISARDLYLRLIQDGVDTWLVKEKILPSQDWKQEIYNAVHEADAVVVCMSQRFDQTDSRQKEIRAAFDSVIAQLDGEVLIIPVRLEQCDRLENLSQWQWVDLFAENGYEILRHALKARAVELGAVMEAKEGSLPQITIPSVKPQEPESEEKPSQAMQEVLETAEGTGILLEGPTVKLERPGSQRRLRRAMLVALLGLI